jgi:hypothetical protein
MGNDRCGRSGARRCKIDLGRRHQSPRARWAGPTYLGKAEEAFLGAVGNTPRHVDHPFSVFRSHGSIALVVGAGVAAIGLSDAPARRFLGLPNPTLATTQPTQPNALPPPDTAGQL